MIEAHAKAPWWWRQLDMVRHFLVFLVVDGPVKIFALWESTASSFEAQLNVIANLENITKPLFQDYTREGRLVGFFLRLGRIAVGIIIQVLIAVIFAALAVAWLALPLYLAFQVFSNLFSLFTHV